MGERKIEKFDHRLQEWREISFGELYKGDIFRIFDNGKRYVNSSDGNNVWIAKGDSYKNSEGVLTIDTVY
jgi:hypothetical protein